MMENTLRRDTAGDVGDEDIGGKEEEEEEDDDDDGELMPPWAPMQTHLVVLVCARNWIFFQSSVLPL